MRVSRCGCTFEAAFSKLGIYEYLEENGLMYAIRLPANEILHEEISHLMTRSVGRPPQKPDIFYDDFMYKSASWSKKRRVIAKVVWHQGELVSPDRIRGDQHERRSVGCRALLQRAWHSREVDQGRKVRSELDTSFV